LEEKKKAIPHPNDLGSPSNLLFSGILKKKKGYSTWYFAFQLLGHTQ
jgi:hypothetical protein